MTFDQKQTFIMNGELYEKKANLSILGIGFLLFNKMLELKSEDLLLNASRKKI